MLCVDIPSSSKTVFPWIVSFSSGEILFCFSSADQFVSFSLRNAKKNNLLSLFTRSAIKKSQETKDLNHVKKKEKTNLEKQKSLFL